jgi:hypothetical protein
VYDLNCDTTIIHLLTIYKGPYENSYKKHILLMIAIIAVLLGVIHRRQVFGAKG